MERYNCIVSTPDVVSILSKLRDLPVKVQDWIVETGTDVSDSEAIWVWAVLADADFAADNAYVVRRRVRQALRDDPRTASYPLYIRFRGASEVRAS
jgi:hypothetical protein